jgi:hypothetical protein
MYWRLKFRRSVCKVREASWLRPFPFARSPFTVRRSLFGVCQFATRIPHSELPRLAHSTRPDTPPYARAFGRPSRACVKSPELPIRRGGLYCPTHRNGGVLVST